MLFNAGARRWGADISTDDNAVMSASIHARPFVGRKADLDTVLEAVVAAEAGRGTFMFIAGEAGIGKTRLAEEAAARAAEGGAVVLWGRAGEAGVAPPFSPWLQVMRTYLARVDPVKQLSVPGMLEALAQLLPELRPLLPAGSSPTVPSDEEGVRIRVFEAVAAVLRKASERRPVMVILDDVHDMDDSSLLLLKHVSGQLSESGVVVVGSYRSEEVKAGSVARSVIREVLRLPYVREILLGGLHGSDVGTYIRQLTGEVPSSTLIGRLVQETDGNALFVTELLRHLQHEGRLRSDVGSIARATLPETVREVIQERVGVLSDACRQLLGPAAVLGREFDEVVLQQVAEPSAEEVLEHLDEAEQAGVFVRADHPHRYRFSHALIRDVMYDELPARTRLDLHRRAADVLEESAGPLLEERASEIAHHLMAAGTAVERDRAVRFAELAAKHAVSRLAYEEAARLYHAALDAVGRSAERRRVELLLGLGDALARSGDAVVAKERFLEAATLARREDLSEHLARAALGYGGRFVWEASRGDPHLVFLLTDALAHMQGRLNATHARLLARLAAGPLRDDPDPSRRDRMSAEAVAIAETLDDLPTLAYVLDGRYAAIWGPDRLEERMRIARRLIDASRRIGDRERELQGHHYLCLASLEAGDLGAAEREATEQRVLAEALKQPAQLVYSMTVDITLAVLQGRYDDAAVLVPQAFSVGQRAEQPMTIIYSLFERYMIARDLGTAGALLGELLGSAARFPTYTVIRALIADAYERAGRRADAAAAVSELSKSGFADIPRNDEWLFAVTLLCDVACDIGDLSAAGTLYELALPFRDRVAVSAPDACAGAVARALGRVAKLIGRDDEALGLFEQGLTINERLIGRPWTARTQYELARLLMQRGDDQRARDLLEACADTADGLGMTWLAADARTIIDRPVPSRDVVRTFLFTDIVQSTELVAALGDEAWESVVLWHDEALRELFAAHDGQEVDHAGDGFFVAFGSPADAVNCGIAIQRRLAHHRRTAGYAPQVRIGIHADRARTGGGAYRGGGVHRAARIGAAAAGGEVLVSEETLTGLAAARAMEVRQLILKGFADPIRVSVIAWDVRQKAT